MALLFIFFLFYPHYASAIVEGRFSDKEIEHIFGIKPNQTIPHYWLDHPERKFDFVNERHQFKVQFDDEIYDFDLMSNTDLFAEGFHIIEHGQNSSDLKLFTPEQHCVFKGISTSHNNTYLSLVGCGEKTRGLLLTDSGEFILLHPVPDRHVTEKRQGTHPHIIHKRSSSPFHLMDPFSETMDKPCLFDAKDDPFPGEEEKSAFLHKTDHERLTVLTGDLTIELGVFADDAMWNHFQDLYGRDADQELQKFILAAANNIHLLYSHNTIQPQINIEIVRYEVMKTPPRNMQRFIHRDGEVDRLLEAFCEYQSSINPISDSDVRHWDHALLFSGYDLYRGRLKSVAGYAPVKGMCSGIRSCTINEGLDFGSVFVITHEMGHSLGMYHDGDNGCDARCCIMSPSVGSGKTSWSRCSMQEFNLFVNRLGTGLLPSNCLLDRTSRRALDHSSHSLPGQRYSLDQQCRIFHGDCWAHELRDGQKLADVCEMVWCGAGEGIIRTTHPALEGTYCGKGKWCQQGGCVRVVSRRPPSVVHGGWSKWNDNPTSNSCGTVGCSTCEVQGQMRVRKSIRTCDNPAPNNGGKVCAGSPFRARVCDQQACSGPKPDQYATRVCTELRNSADAPDLLLSGKGFQYEQQPCKVWCHMQLNSFIRTVGNFPDGTPCGPSSYCIKGKCHKMSCGGDALVEDPKLDCPNSGRIAVSTSRKTETWGKWSQWSACSRTCERGLRQRLRACLGHVCAGSASERELCEEAPCPRESSWASWGDWGSCSATCDGGRQRRKRDCKGGRNCRGSSIEIVSCNQQGCPTGQIWSEWGQWSRCSKTCAGGLKLRRRDCFSRFCHGRTSESSSCNKDDCRKVSKVESRFFSDQATWTSWTDWSRCTRTCGGGNRFRRRQCRGDGICFGSSVTFSSCNNQDCDRFLRDQSKKASWSSWSPWASCSHTCGSNGKQRRTRVCNGSPGNPCRGPSSLSRSCNNKSCDTAELTVVSEWTKWSDWSSCSRTCGRGISTRRRKCKVAFCSGSFRQLRFCASSHCF